MITVKSKHHNYTHTHTQSSKPLILLGRGGVLEPIPAVIGRKAGYTVDRSPVHRRVIMTTFVIYLFIYSFIHSFIQKMSACKQIGRASCRERVCQHVAISAPDVSSTQK